MYYHQDSLFWKRKLMVRPAICTNHSTRKWVNIPDREGTKQKSPHVIQFLVCLANKDGRQLWRMTSHLE